MAKTFQFELLLQLAVDRRDEAAQAIGVAVSRLAMAQERQQQIEQYRDEYRQRLTSDASRGMRVVQWNDFRLFLGRLDDAVEQQGNEVTRCQSLLDHARRHWQECERQVKAYQLLRERHDEREVQLAAKRDQKLADEWASLSHRLAAGDS